MDTKQIAAYVGSGIAIALGVALLYVPPGQLSGEASTVGWAASFITGGLAGVGVTVTVPNVVRTARRTAVAEYDAELADAKRARRSAGAVRGAKTRGERKRGSDAAEKPSI